MLFAKREATNFVELLKRSGATAQPCAGTMCVTTSLEQFVPAPLNPEPHLFVASSVRGQAELTGWTDMVRKQNVCKLFYKEVVINLQLRMKRVLNYLLGLGLQGKSGRPHNVQLFRIPKMAPLRFNSVMSTWRRPVPVRRMTIHTTVCQQSDHR